MDNPDIPDLVPSGLFSDVLAAPNGAPLTVYGTNLSGPLVVGGVALTNCPSIDETVFEEPLGSIRLAKTTCWLENVPLGESYIDAGSSELLPLQVINGNVQTISTFGQFKDAMQDPSPGDFFLLKGFTANLSLDGKTNGGNHILYVRPGEYDATPRNPIALIGYPGDPAKFVVDGAANGDRAISLKNEGWTVSNLDFDTYWRAIDADGEARIIGNRVTAMTGSQRPAGTGSIVAGGEKRGGVVMGNIVTGGRTGWRFDHAIYISDCPSSKGWAVEWNYIHDNNFSRGPQLMINHQNPRCGTGSQNKSVASHSMSNNIVDTTLAPGRCIGVSSYGWEPENNSTPPGVMYIENNFLINCGFAAFDPVDSFGDARRGAAVYDAVGNTVIRGNTFYQTEAGIQVGSTKTHAHPEGWLHTTVTDNVFIDSKTSTDSYVIKVTLHEDIVDDVTIENNVDR